MVSLLDGHFSFSVELHAGYSNPHNLLQAVSFLLLISTFLGWSFSIYLFNLIIVITITMTIMIIKTVLRAHFALPHAFTTIREKSIDGLKLKSIHYNSKHF